MLATFYACAIVEEKKEAGDSMIQVLCAVIFCVTAISLNGQVNWYCPDATVYSSKIDAEVHCPYQSTKRIPHIVSRPVPRFYTIPAPLQPPVTQSAVTGQIASFQGATTGVTEVQSSAMGMTK
jgi:hypothetical protein